MEPDERSEKVLRFEEHVLAYLSDIYRAALRLTGQAADAEDLVQETCLRAFRSLEQLRNPGAARAWLFAILRSVFLRQVEREPRGRARLSLDDIDGSLLTASEVLHDAYERVLPPEQLLRQEARQAILRLPLPYREAIILAHIGGFSYREIARLLAIPTGTVMSRLFRGRRLLRTYLGQSPSHLESSR
ncbi:MAG: sigma-70 family RNA polymerase sigma factor [Candidatus Rokubacteria bacterium]|nr:sigma-70 family RNA polymerase sigma factor [Candidatus Rokubacteria bacterium]